MLNEQIERKMPFIVDTLAQLSVNDHKHEHRLDSLERITNLMVRAGLRARKHLREQDERFERRFDKVNDALADLAQAQKRTEESILHTDKRLDALIYIVRADRNGPSS